MQIEMGFIIAAGMGSRMKGEKKRSKPMQLVNGKHLIRYGIDAMLGSGIEKIYVVYSKYSRDVEYLKDAYPQVGFLLQHIVNGSLSSLQFVAEYARGPFLLLDGDLIITSQNLRNMLSTIPENKCFDVYMAVCDHNIFNAECSVLLKNNDEAIGYEKEYAGDDENSCKRVPGGMAYLWMTSPLKDIKRVSKYTSSMSDYLSEMFLHYKIGAMHIETLWDVDTITDIHKTEYILELDSCMAVNKQPKIIFLDLDGTILDNSGKLNCAVADAVRRAANMGVKIAISTSRSYATTAVIAEALNCSIVSCAGGSVFIRNNKIINSTAMNKSDGIQALRIARDMNPEMNCSVLAEGGSYYNGLISTVLDSNCLGPSWLRILIYNDDEEYAALLVHRLEHLKMRTCVLRGGDILIQSSSAGKLEGIRYILDSFGLRFEDAAYFGDWYDDLPCVAQCGFGAATHDSPSSLKEYARYVCPKGNAGVAQQIDELVRRKQCEVG